KRKLKRKDFADNVVTKHTIAPEMLKIDVEPIAPRLKPRKSKTNVPVSKPKIIKSISANNKEPSKSWGSIVSDVPSSSLDECRLSKLFSGIDKFGNDHVAKIMGYSDDQIGNVIILKESVAPEASLDAIRIFSHLLLTMNMIVYQMDVKTTFLNDIMYEEVYISQPDEFVDQDNLNHVYKLKKALYGLKQAPQQRWILSIALTDYADSEIMRIPIILERRTIIERMQLLGDRLVSSSKRQKSAAIFSTEAEYIALSGCCAQVL
ncbi:retrovirus-related pol polyprotein from transposon TNT 1-94, partial [Tanacetum coccineum]